MTMSHVFVFTSHLNLIEWLYTVDTHTEKNELFPARISPLPAFFYATIVRMEITGLEM